MNLISKAIQEVHFNIPIQILERTFQDPRLHQRGIPVSVDARIRSEVIDKRVRVDCNLHGGLQATIPLASLQPEQLDPFSAIYRIPKSMTQGRTISSALSVSFGQNTRYPGAHQFLNRTSPLDSAVSQVLDSALPVPVVSTAYVQLIGENTIFIEGELTLPRDIYLRCVLTYDEEFSNIKPGSYLAFCQLVVLATKAYIYQHHQIPMDMGYLHGGMTLGTFKEIVDSYADANELYYIHLNEVWRKVAVMNDEQTFRRSLKLLVGHGR